MLAQTRDDSIGVEQKDGYLMINSFEITNFRCFQHVKQDNLKRFNFLVGASGSGKTALLEALFMAGGSNPEIYFRLRKWRGFGDGVAMPQTRDNYESVFRDLFYHFEQSEGATIRFTASNAGNRKLDIFYEDDDVLHLQLKTDAGGSQDMFSITPIVFKWEGPKRVTESKVEIGDNGLIRMKGSRDIYPMSFVSWQTLDPRYNALRYSELSKHGKAGLVLEAMKAVYHQIEDLSLEFIAGEPMLHAAIEGLPEKYPIASLSGGMNKFISIILSIVASRNGAVIIDEIENGFYYRDLPMIVKGIMKVAQDHESQVFATTHSYELLQAVSNVIESNEEFEKDTTLIRLEKPSPCDPPILHLVKGYNYRAAIESDFEVR